MPSKVPRALGPTPTRLRQIALVAQDLEKAEHILTKVIGTEVIFADQAVEQFGLKNSLVAIGGDVIEVVSPVQPNTAAGRILSKRGDGGYMIIMQTVDALARKTYIESKGLARVIFSVEVEDGHCVQYHPKSVKGGVIPEVDSHHPSSFNADPIHTRFSPWHACGPISSYQTYSESMKRHADLKLLGVRLRLEPDDKDTHGAAMQWENILGVKSVGLGVQFTNGRMEFVKGAIGVPEGIIDVTIGVDGKIKLSDVLERARAEGCLVDECLSAVDMLGVRFFFVNINEMKSNL